MNNDNNNIFCQKEKVNDTISRIRRTTKDNYWAQMAVEMPLFSGGLISGGLVLGPESKKWSHDNKQLLVTVCSTAVANCSKVETNLFHATSFASVKLLPVTYLRLYLARKRETQQNSKQTKKAMLPRRWNIFSPLQVKTPICWVLSGLPWSRRHQAYSLSGVVSVKVIIMTEAMV